MDGGQAVEIMIGRSALLIEVVNPVGEFKRGDLVYSPLSDADALIIRAAGLGHEALTEMVASGDMRWMTPSEAAARSACRAGLPSALHPGTSRGAPYLRLER